MWWPWMEARGLKTKRIRKSCTGNPLDLLSPAGFAFLVQRIIIVCQPVDLFCFFLGDLK
jgi:hypothetical protein